MTPLTTDSVANAVAVSQSESKSKTTTSVRFNVGGTVYEVSRSLLDQYPDTMLARLASDTWHPTGKSNDDDCNGALFIERNGERFQYCLDYMRDGGTIKLPVTISKDALLQDLVYCGFEDIDSSKITVAGSMPVFQVGVDHVHSIVKSWDEELLNLENKQRYLNEELEMKQSCLMLARHCLWYYAREGKLDGIPISCCFQENAGWCPTYESESKYSAKLTKIFRSILDRKKIAANKTRAELDLPPAGRCDYVQEFNYCLKRIGLEYKKDLQDNSWKITLVRAEQFEG